MFKKSFYVVIVQFFGVILGLFSIYFVVGDMAPEIYSLVGINTIISGIVQTFSDLGIETVMMREALVWMREEENEKVEEHATQALVSRIIGFCILLPLLSLYVLYLYHFRYNEQFLLLLFVYVIGGGISSLNNSMSLIVRSRGGYVFSQIANTINSYFAKFVGLALFFICGDSAYLYFVGIAPIVMFFVLYMYTRKLYKIRYVRISETFQKIWKYKIWWIKTDIDYFKNSADSFLVSLLFPAAIMGSYTIFKTLENIAKAFIEGFFDVLSQESVRNKGNKVALERIERKIKKVRNLIITIIILGTAIFCMDRYFFIELVNLKNYQYIDLLVLCVAFVSIIYLVGKYEINTIAFFGTAAMNLKLSLFTGGISIGAFLIVILSPNILGVIMLKIISYGVFSLAAIVLFKRYKCDMYTQILK